MFFAPPCSTVEVVSPLEKIIVDKIRAEGPLSFDVFMDAALYYPGLGYYMKQGSSIGRSGDYYTSPHLHSLFGAMIGVQMEEMRQALGSPGRFQIVEIGAGMGHLAEDMLVYLSRKETLTHFEYIIVERNPFVKSIQQECLQDFADRVSWRSSLSELDGVTGCILSNELLDAFPVKLVEMHDDLMEICLNVSESGFIETPLPAGDLLRSYFEEFGIDPRKRFRRGYKTEVNLAVRGWLKEISSKLVSGFVLTIDYGYPAGDYYDEERVCGTLLCYHRHQRVDDPYRNVGDQDITAHVNFSALRKWSEEIGLQTLGFTAQGPYLISLGIDRVVRELLGDEPDSHEISKIKGLILPQGMGESHKVMVGYRGVGTPVLRGFGLRNMLRKL